MDKKYIDREKAMEIVKRTNGDYAAAWSEIRQLPAADVTPVVHGKWINCTGGNATCNQCMVLQKSVYDDYYEQRFCGHCGAKMDGGSRWTQRTD